ncbi:MAG: hypothetical protein GWP10_05460 [Nitrospiraceae bacterium]|nr:hypothetical protein [Nitrospiraceae bacterium]
MRGEQDDTDIARATSPVCACLPVPFDCRQATHRQIGDMVLMMMDKHVMDIGELKTLLASSGVLTFTRRDLCLDRAHIAFLQLSLSLGERRLRRYMEKMTEISCSQLTRLITQLRRSGHVHVRPYQRLSFPAKYAQDDKRKTKLFRSFSKPGILT